MIHKTRGIVLRNSDFSDTSIITKIYTEQFGVQNYLIKGAKRKKSAIKANLFQPLSVLEMVVYKKEKKQLQIIKEAKLDFHFVSIPFDPVKSSILFFINEIILKCIQEEEPNADLFSFLHESIQILDSTEKNFSSIHLIFLVRFSRFLGFYPQGKFSEINSIFDLREGKFVSTIPFHSDFLTNQNSILINRIILSNYYTMDTLNLSKKEKKTLLDILLRYYELHLPHFEGVSSHRILQQLFA